MMALLFLWMTPLDAGNMNIAALVRIVSGPGSRLIFGNFQILCWQLIRMYNPHNFSAKVRIRL